MSLFHLRKSAAAAAATPPVETTLVVNQAALAMHAGHIGSLLNPGYADIAFCANSGGSSALGPQLAGTDTFSIRK